MMIKWNASINRLWGFVLILSSLWTTIETKGQQVPYYAVFRENWVLMNPAFLNHFYLEDKNRTLNINISHREQWVGFEGGPQQSNARIENIAVRKKKILVNVPSMKWGLGMENERLGASSSSGIFGNYAYFFNLNKTTFLSAGLNLSLSNQRFRLDPTTFKDWDNDLPSQLFGSEQRWYGRMDAGIFIKNKSQSKNSSINHWYVGLSTQQLSTLLGKKPHFNFLAGILIGDSNKGGTFGTYWEPSIWIRYLPGATYNALNFKSPISTDVSLRFFMKDKIWLGSGLGTSGNISLETGYIFHNAKNMNSMLVPKIKTGIMCNIPVLGATFGYSVEAFIGIGLATY